MRNTVKDNTEFVSILSTVLKLAYYYTFICLRWSRIHVLLAYIIFVKIWHFHMNPYENYQGKSN